MSLDPQLLSLLREQTACSRGQILEKVQSLWSGYGAIYRFGEDERSFIVKNVSPPNERKHPRGWSGDIGHQRKLRSYEVEEAWYANYASRCDAQCRVPAQKFLRSDADSWLFILEDLDAAGFPRRRSTLSEAEMRACLSWLAHFHATFLGQPGDGLWEVGTYWHLATRPDELEVVEDERLRAAAPLIDAKLNNARYQTLVHGDAKVANFCFSSSGADVAAVDFQYVGGGVGVKDLAYLLSSCLDESACQRHAARWVDVYFEMLRDALADRCSSVDGARVEAEWRDLYPVAWADFVRFLVGWAPEHYKIHGYSRELTEQVLASL